MTIENSQEINIKKINVKIKPPELTHKCKSHIIKLKEVQLLFDNEEHTQWMMIEVFRKLYNERR